MLQNRTVVFYAILAYGVAVPSTLMLRKAAVLSHDCGWAFAEHKLGIEQSIDGLLAMVPFLFILRTSNIGVEFYEVVSPTVLGGRL